MIALRPVFAPLPHGLGVVEGTWSLLHQWQVMQRLEEILLTQVTASVASQQGGSIQNVEVEWIGFDDHITPGPVDWRRVAVGLVDDQTVAIEPGSGRDTAIVRIGRQAAQNGALPLPHLSNGLGLSADPALIVLETGLQQIFSHPAAGWQK